MADQQTKKPSRTWRILLALSLGVNLLVGGFVLGLSGSERKGGLRGFELGPGPLAHALSPQERRSVLRDLRDAGQFGRGEMRGYMVDLLTTLRAKPFDADALQTVMTTQRERLTDIQEAAQSALFSQIVAMTPERRAEFADAVAAGMTRERSGSENRAD